VRELHLLVGCPGSGKSYFVNQQEGMKISRDQIRFAMLKPNDDYFAKERQVFETFVFEVNTALNSGENVVVWADATHNKIQGRKDLLKNLNIPKNTKLVVENFTTPLNTCLFRNNLREGRAKVPNEVIRRFHFSKEEPTVEEFEQYGFKKIEIKER
jgi:predicted kinase